MPGRSALARDHPPCSDRSAQRSWPSLALARPLVAQDDRWQISLDDDRTSGTSGSYASTATRCSCASRTAWCRCPVAHIKELRLIRKSEVELGGNDAAGAMNALVGGDDEVYDLTPLEFADRIRTVQKILLMHPPAPSGRIPATPISSRYARPGVRGRLPHAR